MNIFRRWAPLLLLFLIPAFPVQANQASPKGEQPVRAELISEVESVEPGRPFWVAVKLDMEKGWDTYWTNPGDAGFPTKITWHLPENYSAGEVQWPFPEKFVNNEFVGYGYTGSVLLLTEITPPENAPINQSIEIKADVTWLACKESCIPGEAELSLKLPVKEGAPAFNSHQAAVFAVTRGQLPQNPGVEDLTVHGKEDGIELYYQSSFDLFGEIDELLFIPAETGMIDHLAPQKLQKVADKFVLHVKKASSEMPKSIKGVLVISEKGRSLKRAIQVDAPLSGVVDSPQTPISTELSSFWLALLFAFLGGIILNVMPCVLPVVALKIFGFVKMAQQNRMEVVKHGLVFSVGVLVSFWVLTSILLLLRAYGASVGWGFQLQEPIFVVVLTSIIFLLGLSLFGLFEFGTSLISLGSKSSSSSSPLANSFMSGIFATLVATPCTGPLLGPALGFAMTLPSVQTMVIFTAMALGMAFPYLFFSLFPSLVRFLPKPGNWMITFKQIMGFLMMATVLWLVWVFGAQTGMMAIVFLLGAMLLMAVGGWIYGRWATPLRKKATRRIATLLSLLLILGSGYAAIQVAKDYKDAPQEVIADGKWEQFSAERIAELRAEGTPVFVDFTAKWCLICQANKLVLHSSDIAKEFEKRGVVVMEADWTKKDAAITQELQKLGRSGVPVYALYPGDTTSSPTLLPQTLSSTVVIDHLDELKSTN